MDPLQIASHHYSFPDPPSAASPTSSNEAEPDLEHHTLDVDHDRPGWDYPGMLDPSIDYFEASSPQYSDIDSGSSDVNPFADSNIEEKDKDNEKIPNHERKSLDSDL